MNGQQMQTEMSAQPTVLGDLGARQEQIAALVHGIVPRPLRGIVLVARGSSDNAAIHGRYVLETAARVPVALAAPSLHTRYGVTTTLDGFLAIAISQSGATPEIVSTLQALEAGGAATLGITNVAGSPLADVAHATVLLGAGEEHAVPATKTFTAQVVAMCLIADALADGPLWETAGWARALEAVRDALDTPDAVTPLVERLVQAQLILPVARGYLYGAALEVGLKLAETTGLAVTGISTADLHHGPIATVGAQTLGLCLAASGPVAADVATIAEALVERGGHVAVITADPSSVPAAGSVVPVLGGVPEPLAALAHVVRGQQLALATARALGVDPDEPFALQKVTRTT